MLQATIKSAQRVLEIFERFDRTRRPLSLKEVSDDLGYPVSSAAALLKSLVRMGYLEYNKHGLNYLPTMKIAMLGAWVPEERFGRTNILSIMESIRAATGESVFLGTRSDLFAQYVHVTHSEAPMRYLVEPGSLRPLARSGLGQLLLSKLSERELGHTVRRLNFSESDPNLRVDLVDLKRIVKEIKADGYVFAKGLVAENAGIIGVLLPDAPFGRTYAIGVAGLIANLEASFRTILDLLFEASTQFGEGLAVTNCEADVTGRSGEANVCQPEKP